MLSTTRLLGHFRRGAGCLVIGTLCGSCQRRCFMGRGIRSGWRDLERSATGFGRQPRCDSDFHSRQATAGGTDSG